MPGNANSSGRTPVRWILTNPRSASISSIWTFLKDNIKEFLIYWIQHGEPKGYSESQMDELDRLTEQWAEDIYPGEN